MSVIFKSKANLEIPEDAVRMSEDQAIRYQMKIISEWPNFSEVFGLRTGPGILGMMAGISSYVINSHFRNKLKLKMYGRMSSYLTVVATPVMLSSLLHATSIQSRVLLQNYDCPICIQTRAAVMQATTGAIYPCFLAPFAAFFYATRHFTFRLPSITAEPREVVKLWFKFTKSAGTKISVLVAANAFVAMLITARQISEHANVNFELSEYEKKFDSGSLPEQHMQEEYELN